ncbi:MAG: DUF839 domain-containing protein [Oleiphilaceae bacterium]|nr:DUF839 domain-containing protein [Oleiphilaceae bacterium]
MTHNRFNTSRRAFLQNLFLGTVGVSLYGCKPFSDSSVSPTDTAAAPDLPLGPVIPASQLPFTTTPLSGIGPLVESDINGVFIPEGFSIRRVARSGSIPVVGSQTPWHTFPDGGAVFDAPDGGWVYVPNSEIDPDGGVGAIRFNAIGELTDNYRILTETRRNCAGGPTPWQTWLSCEEVGDGLVYECDPFGDETTARVLPKLGVFNHEAVAVDAATRTLYLTEDSGSGRLYRFTSAGSATAINGQSGLDLDNGVLEVLEIDGFENGAYQEDLAAARQLKAVKWVPVRSPERPQADVRREIMETTGQPAPGTVFKGGEGIWMQQFSEGERAVVAGSPNPLRAVVFFACKGDNRVYALDIDNDLIEVVFDNEQLSDDELPFDDVDNLVVGPAGDVIVSEDGDAMRLMVLTPNQPSRILLQITGGGSELTGPAFTSDGSRLYFSSQRGPVTLGIPNLGETFELTIPEAFRGRQST